MRMNSGEHPRTDIDGMARNSTVALQSFRQLQVENLAVSPSKLNSD
jgi:hypothetical protein